MTDIKYTVWLSTKCTPDTKANTLLLDAFDGDCKMIYEADDDAFKARCPGVSDGFVTRLCDKDLNDTMQIIDYCARNNIGLLPFDSPQYPKRLKRIKNYPVLLYYKGRFPDFDECPAIATVGTRRATDYGRRNAYVISRDLARAGMIVVSGMASGIDSKCHRGALDSGGLTAAVLGCGIDVVYPKSNEELMNELVLKGSLITEYAPGTEPVSYNFPRRNRIISGLSLGTLVVEADEKSGAMITAKYAREQGRDLFAVPGNVGELNSLGTNRLIKDGARMVTSALDILDEYEYVFPQKIRTDRILFDKPSITVTNIKNTKVAAKPPVAAPSAEKTSTGNSGVIPDKNKPSAPEIKLTPDERAVYDAMPQGRSITCDEISRASLPIAKTLTALTTLEIKKLVTALPGGKYIKI